MNIEKFIKEDMNIKINILKDGEIELNLEDIAKGLGFTNERDNNIRYDRVKKYTLESYEKCSEIVPPEVVVLEPNTFVQGRYVPERILYMLMMRAKSKTACKFQVWISKEVLPSIRKNNFYIDNENITSEQISNLEKEIKKLKIEKGILHEIVYDISDATTMSFTEVSKKIFNKDAKYLKNILIEHKFLAEDGYTPLLKEADFKLPNGGVQKMRIFTTTNVEKCRKAEDIKYNKITNFGYMFIKKHFNKLGLTNFNFNKEGK